MSEREWNDFLIGDEADLRSIISWQQERYRHLQLLSQSMLATSLTILTVIATVYTALGSPLPSFPYPEVSHGPEFVGVIATQIIIGFSNLLTLIIGFIAVSMFVASIWKFIEIVLKRPLPSETSISGAILSRNYSNQHKASLLVKDVPSKLSVLVWENNRSIGIMQGKFRSAGFRFPVSLLFLFISLEYYLLAVDYAIIWLTVLSATFISSSMVNPALKRVLGHKDPKPVEDPREITLFQEFFLDEEHEFNRLSNLKSYWWERLAFITVKPLSAIIVVAFSISYFV